MEAACQPTADGLCFRPPLISHAVAFMVMALSFHVKDPDGVGYALNIFLLPDLFPSAGSEAALLTRKWDAILGEGTLTYFSDKSLLVGKQNVAPIAVWDKASYQLEAWAVFCTLFLGDEGAHPATYEMFLLLEETSRVSPRLRAQARHQPTSPAALLRLIQQEFNESFRQALERQQRLIWPNFESLRKALAYGNFRPELVTLPGGLASPEHPLPPPSETRRLAAIPQTAGNTPTPHAQVRRGDQVKEHNPRPAPYMQVRTGFRIRTAINAAAVEGVGIPQTNDGRHFFL